jgi:hypothetical protein
MKLDKLFYFESSNLHKNDLSNLKKQQLLLIYKIHYLEETFPRTK